MTSSITEPPSESEHPSLPPDIHLIVDKKTVGPIEPDEIVRLYAKGAIGDQTLAWHPALDDWRKISLLPEIFWLIASYEASLEAQAPESALESPPMPVLADFAPRFAAGALDMLIWLTMVVAIGVPLGFILNRLQASDGPLLGVRFDIFAQCGALLYFVLLMSRIGGGTPGYHLFRLKLVDRDNLQAPGLIQTFVWYITSYLRLVGCLTYFIDTQHRMLHNYVSRTLVIVVRAEPAIHDEPAQDQSLPS